MLEFVARMDDDGRLHVLSIMDWTSERATSVQDTGPLRRSKQLRSFLHQHSPAPSSPKEGMSRLATLSAAQKLTSTKDKSNTG